ncbi:MAG: HesA/MoeB/ThiF family protein [Candidatus Margulisbacteria bacterium]|jgi:adenylyltransferase/sulfurtransferase|nr:HesA/MoeB/ThiF family protein [Candidatus Margulisiibacteriota bacterium]
MNFTDEQLERYSRHIILKNVGIEGQEKICAGKVLIIGTGGLGAPAALYLAAAGVGVLGLVDGDVVDRTNLQRQVIHFTPDIGKPKVISAQEKIARINPEVKVKTYHTLALAHNINELIKDYDFIIDATDNFPAKFLINDACVLAGKPFSHGGILRFDGQTLTHLPGTACYRCVFSAPPPKDLAPTCAQAGVLGAVAGMLGTIQAAEALKYLTGAGELLTDRLLIFDALTMNYRTVKIKRNENCPLCGKQPAITQLRDEEQPVCELKLKKG